MDDSRSLSLILSLPAQAHNLWASLCRPLAAGIHRSWDILTATWSAKSGPSGFVTVLVPSSWVIYLFIARLYAAFRQRVLAGRFLQLMLRKWICALSWVFTTMTMVSEGSAGKYRWLWIRDFRRKLRARKREEIVIVVIVIVVIVVIVIVVKALLFGWWKSQKLLDNRPYKLRKLKNQ